MGAEGDQLEAEGEVVVEGEGGGVGEGGEEEEDGGGRGAERSLRHRESGERRRVCRGLPRAASKTPRRPRGGPSRPTPAQWLEPKWLRRGA